MSRFKNLTNGQYAIIFIVLLFLVLLLVYFATQTWELVDWLFPKQNQWMKVGALFSFDIMAFVWSLACMLWTFSGRGIKFMAELMGVVSFVLATIASILQMYMSATERLNFLLDPDMIKDAYILVIVAVTLQLIMLGICVRVEWHSLFGSNVAASAPRPTPGGPGGMQRTGTPVLPQARPASAPVGFQRPQAQPAQRVQQVGSVHSEQYGDFS